jgi:hypothetical protein
MGEEPSQQKKGARLVGKWDWIVCSILAFLSIAGKPHTLGLGQAPLEWISQWIGALAAILLVWLIIKLVAHWIRRKFPSKSTPRSL